MEALPRRRIALRVPMPAASVQQALADRLAANGHLEGRVRRQALLVWLRPPERRWWSPCLDVNILPDGDHTRLEGYTCAQPPVMTAMIFVSIFLTFMALFSATCSVVQWTMDDPPRCLFGTVAACAGLGAVATAQQVGARWAESQIERLVALLDGLGVPAAPNQ